MPVAETFPGNQWPVDQFNALLKLGVDADMKDVVIKDEVHVRGLLLKQMLAVVTPAGNA